MNHKDVKPAFELLKQYQAMDNYMQQAAALPDDRVLQARFDLPGGERLMFPISKKTVLNDLLAGQASIADKLAKLGVDLNDDNEPAEPVGPAEGEGRAPPEGGRDPQPEGGRADNPAQEGEHADRARA